MQQIIKKIALLSLASALVAPFSLTAQEKEKEKEKEKKDAEQIIIMRKGDKTDKVVVELQGEKVLVNGKEIKDGDDNITVHRTKIKDIWAYGGNSSWNGEAFRAMAAETNRPMLGVTTDKVEGGVEIQEITKESGAEKAGLKKGDVIKKINDTKIETPDGLSAAIKKFKPGEKVNVTYARDKKDHTVSAELSKWKGVNVYTTAPGQFNFDMGDLNLGGLQALPRARSYNYNQNWSWSGGGPKLGISVQDTEDGKGVKVLEADDDGNAYKAGIRENDVLTEVDGKAVNSADEVAKIIRESKDKTSVKMKLLRNGKTETLDVKIPRRLKTADL